MDYNSIKGTIFIAFVAMTCTVIKIANANAHCLDNISGNRQLLKALYDPRTTTKLYLGWCRCMEGHEFMEFCQFYGHALQAQSQELANCTYKEFEILINPHEFCTNTISTSTPPPRYPVTRRGTTIRAPIGTTAHVPTSHTTTTPTTTMSPKNWTNSQTKIPAITFPVESNGDTSDGHVLCWVIAGGSIVLVILVFGAFYVHRNFKITVSPRPTEVINFTDLVKLSEA